MHPHKSYITAGQQNCKASSNLGATTQAQREIGYLDRISGVRNGLDEINDRLTSLYDRIDGNAGGKSDAGPKPSGMAGNLAHCEERIRVILSTIGALETSF